MTTAAFAFVFGTLIGSFLNVVIYRVPAKLSVVYPGSRCPSCHTPIRWYDNIPIASWIVLGRKCRACGVAISARYAFVEALTGLLALALWWQAFRGLLDMQTLPELDKLWPFGIVFAMRFTFVSILIVITFVDFDTFHIPNQFTIVGIVVGLASPWAMQALFGPVDYLRLWPPVTPVSSLAGAIAGFVSVVAIFYLYLAIRGVEGIGGGDATLMAVVGAWLGWPALIFVFFAASLQGLIAAGITMALGLEFVRDSVEMFADEEPDTPEEEEGPDEEGAASDAANDDNPEELDVAAELPEGKAAIPFGPFIALAAVEFLLLGPLLPPELNLVYMYF